LHVESKLARLIPYFGFITPIFGFSVILLAVSSAPWFSWTENALSDLGVFGLSAVIFNNGLIITAAMMMVFCAGIWGWVDGDVMGRAGAVLFFLAAAFLVGIGAFPETAGRIHYYVSVGFFVSMPLSLFTMAVYMLQGGMRRLGLLSLLLGGFAAVVWMPNWDGVAIPEALSALAVGAWSAAMGSRMLVEMKGVS
jgi:hypothetical membrane protein